MILQQLVCDSCGDSIRSAKTAEAARKEAEQFNGYIRIKDVDLCGKCHQKRTPPKDQPYGHSHKQGLELMTSGSDPKDFGGNKT